MTTCKRCKITHWRSGECHAIPHATICNPPEPTVIDESDLAPGMVVVAVDDTQPLDAWVATPDAVLTTAGLVVMRDGCYLADTRLGDRHDVEGWIRRVAGDPC